MDFFDVLGKRVDRLWKERNYSEVHFPEIAIQVLRESPPNTFLDFGDVVRSILFEDPLPNQADIASPFGHPPVTVFTGRDFRIDVLFWVSGLPNIHQHGFSGAFHVFHGSSIHTVWKFSEADRISNALILGDLIHHHSELLKVGDSRPIISGTNFIHCTFHLDRPTVSIVIRTFREDNKLPQYSYIPPSVAYSEDIPHSVYRRVQILRMLSESGRRGDFYAAMRHLLATSDVVSVFHYLRAAYFLTVNEEERHDLLISARSKNDALVRALKPALKYLDRRERIMSLRRGLNQPDIQFFLALLLNVSDRSAIFDLIKHRYSVEDPLVPIIEWVSVLSERGLLGVRFNDSWLVILRYLMSGLSETEAHFEFCKAHGIESTERAYDEVIEVYRGLRDYWLFDPILNPKQSTEQIGLQARPPVLTSRAESTMLHPEIRRS